MNSKSILNNINFVIRGSINLTSYKINNYIINIDKYLLNR